MQTLLSCVQHCLLLAGSNIIGVLAYHVSWWPVIASKYVLTTAVLYSASDLFAALPHHLQPKDIADKLALVQAVEFHGIKISWHSVLSEYVYG